MSEPWNSDTIALTMGHDIPPEYLDAADNFVAASAFIGSMIKPSGFERQKKLRQNQMGPFT